MTTNLILNDVAEDWQNRMVIYIPTYRRMDKQWTWKHLPKEWRKRTFLVAPEEDVNSLKFYNREANILIQPPEIKTIGEKRAWIINQCPAPKLFMMDDDLRFAGRINQTDPNLQKFEVNDPRMIPVLDEIEAKLNDYAHVAISPRQGNNSKEWGWHENKRMIYAFGFQTEIAKTCIVFNRVLCREDMDYTLQLLKQGFKNAVAFHVTADQVKFNAPGGCQKERSMEQSNEQAELLAALHPGLVKVVEKDYKCSIPRKEVVVQWIKAYEEGLKNIEQRATEHDGQRTMEQGTEHAA